MSLELYAADALQHFGAGAALSGVDYAFARVRTNKETRLAEKRDCLDSMLRICASNGSPESTEGHPADAVPLDSLQYARLISSTRKHLTKYGTMNIKAPSLKERFSLWLSKEKVNNLSAGGAAYTTICLELIDFLVAVRGFSLEVMHESPLGSFMKEGYEMPAFFCGLYAGRGATKVAHWMRSGEEKKLDRAIEELCHDTPVLDYIVDPPKETVDHLGKSAAGAKLVGRAKRLFGGVASRAGEVVSDIGESGERRRAAREEADQNARSRFDELTRRKR